MKVIFSISLALVFFLESLFPKGLALAESSKMMELIGHFEEHIVESADDISFTEFLWMHYNPDSDHENEEHHHERLPNLSITSSFVGFIYENFSVVVSPILSVIIPSGTVLTEYKNGYQFLFSLDLLHPPQ